MESRPGVLYPAGVLANLLLIAVMLLVGMAQVAAIRRLISRRTAGSRRHGWALATGGALLLVACFATGWTPGLPMPAWFTMAIILLASTAIIAGVALVEASKRND